LDIERVEDLVKSVLSERAAIYEIRESYGVAILEGGDAVKILNNFKAVYSCWMEMKKRQYVGDIESEVELMTQILDGGIVDTGDVMIDIQTIKYMIPIYRFDGINNDDLDVIDTKHSSINDYMDKFILE
jgi:hypothetical protein